MVEFQNRQLVAPVEIKQSTTVKIFQQRQLRIFFIHFNLPFYAIFFSFFKSVIDYTKKALKNDLTLAIHLNFNKFSCC